MESKYCSRCYSFSWTKGPITPQLTAEEEKANAEMMQYGLLQVYGKTLNYYRQYPEFNTKFTQEQIKKVRGY